MAAFFILCESFDVRICEGFSTLSGIPEKGKRSLKGD